MSEGLERDFSGEEGFIRRFPIHRACRDGDVGVLVSLFQQLSSPAHLTAEDSCYGWSPLHWAAHYGQLECVVRLVQVGCEVNAVTSRFNQTATHTAAFGGHPHCVVWLTQAGADVNVQDFVAGKLARLKNASGQTAADLAHGHGFLDCFHFISKTKKHLLQLSGLHVSGVHDGNTGPCGQGLLSRKRLLTAVDTGDMKKARGADVLVQSSGGEDQEMNMNMESAQEIHSDDDTKAITNGHHRTPSADRGEPEPPRSISSQSSAAANQQAAAAAAPAQHSSADMCGSLHLSGSPSSCVSHRPAWRGLIGADCRDFLHYGHYHGFGDTAEELSDSSCSIQAEHRYKQAVASAMQLYHD